MIETAIFSSQHLAGSGLNTLMGQCDKKKKNLYSNKVNLILQCVHILIVK